MSANRERGDAGETLAANFLETHKYIIVERNVHMKRGEIDIVARQGGDLVFIEVKTRSGHTFGSPGEAITPGKMRSLALAAREYLYANLMSNERVRCDVVLVDIANPDEPDIQLVRNAVDLGDMLD